MLLTVSGLLRTVSAGELETQRDKEFWRRLLGVVLRPNVYWVQTSDIMLSRLQRDGPASAAYAMNNMA